MCGVYRASQSIPELLTGDSASGLGNVKKTQKVHPRGHHVWVSILSNSVQRPSLFVSKRKYRGKRPQTVYVCEV